MASCSRQRRSPATRDREAAAGTELEADVGGTTGEFHVDPDADSPAFSAESASIAAPAVSLPRLIFPVSFSPEFSLGLLV